MSKDYDDPMKISWRERWLDFIKQFSKSTYRNAKKQTVLCMPGEEGYEITQIYDLHGIKRQNITAVEKNKQRATKLSKRFKDVNIVCCDIKDFLRTTDMHFDIINLDYESTLGDDTIAALRYIAARQLLADPGGFALTVSAKREGERSKLLYLKFFREVDYDQKELNRLRWTTDLNETEIISQVLKEKGIDKLKVIKSLSLTDLIIAQFLSGKEWLEASPLVKDFPRREELETFLYENKQIEQSTVNELYGSDFGYFIEELNKRLDEKAKAAEKCIKINPNASGYLEERDDNGFRVNLHVDTYIQQVLSDWLAKRGFPRGMITLLQSVYSGVYLPVRHLALSYTSKNNYLMFSDFLVFSQKRNLLEKYRKLAENLYTEDTVGPFAITDSHIDEHYDCTEEKRVMRRELKKARCRLQKDIDELNSFVIRRQRRMHIGSSAAMDKLNGKLYHKIRLDEETHLGRPFSSDEEISFHRFLKKWFKVTDKQLNAFNVHYNSETHGDRLEIPLETLVSAIAKGKSFETIKKEFSGYSLQGSIYAATKYLFEKGVYDALIQNNFEKEPKISPAPINYEPIILINSANPYKFFSRMSKDAQLRMRYFVQEDIPLKTNLSNEEIEKLYEEIRATKWYKNAISPSETKPSDMAIRTFFDDILIYTVRNNTILNRNQIDTIYSNALREFPAKN